MGSVSVSESPYDMRAANVTALHAIRRENLGSYEGQYPKVVSEEEVPDVLAARDYMMPELQDMLRARCDEALAATTQT